MAEANLYGGLIGGLLIGLAASLFLLVNGRIAGISGILAGLITSKFTSEWFWRAAFVIGLGLRRGHLRLAARRITVATSSWKCTIGARRTARRVWHQIGFRLHFRPRYMRLSAPFTALTRRHGDFHRLRHTDCLSNEASFLMLPTISSFALGILFGLGLSISEMTDPARVIGFLDIAGRWDPTLICVMGGALAVTLPLFPWIQKRQKSLLGEPLQLPSQTRIDARLIIGAAIFGIGWGLAGLCPGPALANLASASPGIALFVLAMIAGQWLAIRFGSR